MRFYLTILIAFLFAEAVAQPSDFFLLRKRDKTIQSYYTGKYIKFTLNSGYPYEGYIKKVHNDSVWIEYKDVQRKMTYYGGVVLDTITYPAQRFAIKEISSVSKEGQRLSEAALPGVMQIAGGGYVVLHVVNGLIQKDEIKIANLAASIGIFSAGLIWKKLQKDEFRMGKRYSIKYIAVTDNQ